MPEDHRSSKSVLGPGFESALAASSRANLEVLENMEEPNPDEGVGSSSPALRAASSAADPALARSTPI